MPKVVTIGGGTGQYQLLAGMRDLFGVKITSIVSMFDNGKSSGKLREESGILPPGDILKCLLALSERREEIIKTMQYRFESEGKLKGHSFGNILLFGLFQIENDFIKAVQALSEALNVKGTVLPVTTDQATLIAELVVGGYIYGETQIDIPQGERKKIKKIFLVPHNSEVKLYPFAEEAILDADYIIIGPGDLYTSIIPNFLVSGAKEAIKKSEAKIIYILNLMTKYGETNGFRGEDFVLKIEEYIDKKVDFVIVNSMLPDKNTRKMYQEERAFPVIVLRGDKRFIESDFLAIEDGVVRHHSLRLARRIEDLIKKDFS